MKSNFRGTIAEVAAIGYKEFAGYFNHSPSEVRAILDNISWEFCKYKPVNTRRASLTLRGP